MRSVRQMVVVAGLAAALIALPGTAWAGFTAVNRTVATVSSASVVAPGALSATKKCTVFGLGGDSLTLNWTPSTTVAVSGYAVYLNASGSGTDITKSVAGRTASSITVTVAVGTTYSITVSSVLQNWTAASTSVSAGCGLFG